MFALADTAFNFSLTFLNIVCKLGSISLLTIVQNSTLLIVTMTVDRLIAVKFPLRAVSLSTVKRAKIAIISIFAFSVMFNIPAFFRVNSTYEGECAPAEDENLFLTVYAWLSFFLNGVAPSCVFPAK